MDDRYVYSEQEEEFLRKFEDFCDSIGWRLVTKVGRQRGRAKWPRYIMLMCMNPRPHAAEHFNIERKDGKVIIRHESGKTVVLDETPDLPDIEYDKFTNMIEAFLVSEEWTYRLGIEPVRRILV